MMRPLTERGEPRKRNRWRQNLRRRADTFSSEYDELRLMNNIQIKCYPEILLPCINFQIIYIKNGNIHWQLLGKDLA